MRWQQGRDQGCKFLAHTQQVPFEYALLLAEATHLVKPWVVFE
jgi:hypothetical protein